MGKTAWRRLVQALLLADVILTATIVNFVPCKLNVWCCPVMDTFYLQRVVADTHPVLIASAFLPVLSCLSAFCIPPLLECPQKDATAEALAMRSEGNLYAFIEFLCLMDSCFSRYQDRLGCLHVSGRPPFSINFTRMISYRMKVTGFLSGERNFENLKGDTGPLVYPAGFLYIYSAIQYLTGGAVLPAQYIFGLIYILNLYFVFSIYSRTKVTPWWALLLLILSKRLHSIFVLRLFNDCVAITLAHASILLFVSQRWYSGMTIFSLAVSVKMSVLLYAPSLLLLLLKALPLAGVCLALSLAALTQIFLGIPFLVSYPMAYVSRAFNLGRVFIHFWSVNFKFVPELLFVSKSFALLLMAVHLSLLFLFAQHKWCKHENGLVAASELQNLLHNSSGKHLSFWKKAWGFNQRQALRPEHVVGVLFTGNFIGIIAARSLHYQFYSWYFYSLPYLLWKATLPTPVRLLLFALIEGVWNVYPSTATSSLVLLACHLTILWGLWHAPSEYPYIKKPEKANKDGSSKDGAAPEVPVEHDKRM